MYSHARTMPSFLKAPFLRGIRNNSLTTLIRRINFLSLFEGLAAKITPVRSEIMQNILI